MSPSARSRNIGIALLAFVAFVAACARPSASNLPFAPRAADRSIFCRQLADRFVGLPAIERGPKPVSGSAPLAGRFWIRTCSASPRGDELDVRLEGAGWYWVDERKGAFAVRQQVPFDLDLELSCRIHASTTAGIFSVWFEPTREPSVSVKARRSLDVRSNNAWGSMLRLLPFLPISARATERFSETAATAFRNKLLSGATLTYDVATGQSDGALNRLVGGQKPVHPFTDPSPWIVNDRLLLEPSSTHVVGPLEPGSFELDVVVEQGAGVDYRALCVDDMDASFDAVASGKVGRIPGRAVIHRGDIVGGGPHTVGLRVDACRFYLVVSALERSRTVAALRVRP